MDERFKVSHWPRPLFGDGFRPDVVIVGIDRKSQEPERLGRFRRWPRSHFARAIRNLYDAGALIIGVDVFFDSPSDADGDAALSEVLTDEYGEAVVLALEEAPCASSE